MEKEGFCWASNGYLAKLYNAGSRSVSRRVAELVEAGFIVVEAAVNQHGQRKIYVAECASPNLAGQKWQAKNGEQIITSKRSVQEDHPPREFELFWEGYPNKVGRKACLKRWLSAGLNKQLTEILAGLERWKASDRWKRGYVADPLTFLNQERWKDVPPAAPSSQAKREMNVRKSTPDEKAKARWDQEVMRQRKLSENLHKSDDELAKLAHEALYGSAA